MKLRLNTNPCWAQIQIDNMFRCWECFGEYSFKELEDISNKVALGEVIKRCSSDAKCYEIYEDDQYVGDVVLVHDEETSYEIDLLIFEDFRCNGYAKQAINLIIKEVNDEFGLIAVVKHNNPKRYRVIAILKELGFFEMADGIYALPKR